MRTDRELLQMSLETLEMEAKGYADRHQRLMPVISALTERLKRPDGWDNVTDDQLIEEVRRRGFPIRSATIIHPKPQAYLDTGLGAFYWSREFPEGPPPGFAPVYIDYTAK